MTLTVCFCVPSKAFAERRFAGALERWWLDLGRAAFPDPGPGRRRWEEPLAVYGEAEACRLEGIIETSRAELGELMPRYRIIEAGMLGEICVGARNKRARRFAISDTGKRAVDRLRALVADHYRWGEVGVWLCFLRGSQQIPRFQRVAGTQPWSEIRKRGLIANSVVVLPPAAGA